MEAPYHHGNLPDALRAAAADVIAEKGVANFSLREVARRAGVSHAAPAHHFGDSAGLLTSLAAEGLEKLYELTSAAAATTSDPVERLVAIGRAYVDVAVRYPAHCEVAFRSDLVCRDAEAYQAGGAKAYGVLEDAVGAVAAELNPDLDVDVAAKLCWSAMQGLVVLGDNMARMDELTGRGAFDRDELAARFTRLMVEGFRTRG
jgi:AcrR family transcriptional regulator